MLDISPELKAAFMEGTFCTLVRITTELGKVYGYTDYPVQLTYEGTAFDPTPSLIRLRSYQTTSTQSNSQKVDIYRVGDFTDEELSSGLFDNAVVEVLRVVAKRLDLGHLLLSKEAIAASKWDETSLSFNVLDLFRGLNQQVGTQNSPYCRHKFGDSFSEAKRGACTLNASSFTINATITGVTRQKTTFTFTSTRPDMWFANGVVRWTLGFNAGAEGTIKTDSVEGSVHTATLFVPTTFNINVGDQVKIIVGCDGTFETCNGKFSNGRNFGGNPLLNPGVTQR